MSSTATAMESERTEAERERVTKATAERKAKEAAKPTAKKKGASPKLTDAELAVVVKKFATVDGATKSGVVKAVR